MRDIIEVPTVEFELKDNVGILYLHQFGEQTNHQWNTAVDELLAACYSNGNTCNGIILDVRNNPGGYLEVAQEIAGWFLEKGKVVVIEDFGEGRGQEKLLSQGDGKLGVYPIVILINEGSASGSEILAGALRDNRGVQLIGKNSFGKGSVQKMSKLKDNSSLKVTVAKWLTPAGDLITDKGLVPDVEIEMSLEDYDQENDPQFDKAIEIIKGL